MQIPPIGQIVHYFTWVHLQDRFLQKFKWEKKNFSTPNPRRENSSEGGNIFFQTSTQRILIKIASPLLCPLANVWPALPKNRQLFLQVSGCTLIRALINYNNHVRQWVHLQLLLLKVFLEKLCDPTRLIPTNGKSVNRLRSRGMVLLVRPNLPSLHTILRALRFRIFRV